VRISGLTQPHCGVLVNLLNMCELPIAVLAVAGVTLIAGVIGLVLGMKAGAAGTLRDSS